MLQGLKVEPQTLLDVSGAVPESVTDGLLAACHSNTFGAVQAAITNAIADGWGVRHAHRPMHTCGTGLLLAVESVRCFGWFGLQCTKFSHGNSTSCQMGAASAASNAALMGHPEATACSPCGVQKADTAHACVTAQAQQLLLELQAGLLKDEGLADAQRGRICTAIAEADKALVDGSDEFLQLLNVASTAQRTILQHRLSGVQGQEVCVLRLRVVESGLLVCMW